MKKSTWISILLFLNFISIEVRANATEYELLTTTGSEKYPIVMDVESVNQNISVVANDDAEYGFLKIINVNPFYREDYSIKVNQTVTLPMAFDKQSKAVEKDKVVGVAGAPQESSCNDKSLSAIASLFNGKVSEVINDLNKNGSVKFPGCDEYISELINASVIKLKFQVSPGIKTSIELTYKNTVHSTIVDVKPIEWMTHVGFTFAGNKNNKYYSKEHAATTGAAAYYEIVKQAKRSDFDYGATVLFTYPIKSWKSVQFGPTAGLASDANTVAVVIGGSFIFNQNVALSFGLEAKQYDELKGVYKEGQNVGDKALDSSILNEKQFKVAPMISIGYRFK